MSVWTLTLEREGEPAIRACARVVPFEVADSDVYALLSDELRREAGIKTEDERRREAQAAAIHRGEVLRGYAT